MVTLGGLKTYDKIDMSIFMLLIFEINKIKIERSKNVYYNDVSLIWRFCLYLT
jgi:hypothetical protein